MTTDTQTPEEAAIENGARLVLRNAAREFEKGVPEAYRHIADLSRGIAPDLAPLTFPAAMKIGWALSGTVKILAGQTTAELGCTAMERAVAMLVLMGEFDRVVRWCAENDPDPSHWDGMKPPADGKLH